MKTSGRREIKSRGLPRIKPLKTSQKVPSIKIKTFLNWVLETFAPSHPQPLALFLSFLEEQRRVCAPDVSQECSCQGHRTNILMHLNWKPVV